MFNFNKRETSSFLAHLLHPTSNVDMFIHSPREQAFWNLLVRVGSSNLVLPSIYASIKRKKLDSKVPGDLLIYLNEIYKYNNNRNKEILRQINHISFIFKNNKINHVFIKGAALLIFKPYDSICERMIGDIDVLVSEKDLFKSKKLLQENGYKNNIENEQILAPEMDNFNKKNRHLERLINPSFIASVELHREVLSSKYISLLPSNKMLECKQKIDDYWIPSKFHLWYHSILNLQINDNAIKLNYISFRTLIDVLYLEPKNIQYNIDDFHKSIKLFYNLVSTYFDEYPACSKFLRYNYILQLELPFLLNLNRFCFKTTSFFQLFISRAFLFVDSKKYRQKISNNIPLVKKKLIQFWKK